MEILRRAVQRCRVGERLALATVVDVRGSVPRHVGAHMLIGEDGSIFGTIGGGRVEHEVAQEGALIAAGSPARVFEYHLVRDLAMCCGGTMEILVEPVAPSVDVLAAAVAATSDRSTAVLVTVLPGGPKTLDRSGTGPRAACREGAVFREPIGPRDRVLLFGCGHVARAIGPLAAGVGFDVVLCDDDETGALTEPPPWATHVVPSFELSDVEAACGPLGRLDYVLIVTRDHAIDQRLLEHLLPNDRLAYLGLIGSRGKVGRFHKRLEAKGIATEERWARLHAPIGLDIGAETPSEIAVSVVAQLIDVRHKERR